MTYAEWCHKLWQYVGEELHYGGMVNVAGDEHRQFGNWSVDLRPSENDGVSGVSVRIVELAEGSGAVGGVPLWFALDRDIRRAAAKVAMELLRSKDSWPT